jgi:hypothetical protein
MLKNEMKSYVRIGGRGLKILRTLSWRKGRQTIAKNILT